ncbi:MAG: hypothetical protein IJ828_11445 [Treponema sp.]|nr:hypothetical protein [Treponema sp.]
MGTRHTRDRSVLEFYVPEDLNKETLYHIAIRTDFMGRDKRKKKPVTAFSDKTLYIR